VTCMDTVGGWGGTRTETWLSCLRGECASGGGVKISPHPPKANSPTLGGRMPIALPSLQGWASSGLGYYPVVC